MTDGHDDDATDGKEAVRVHFIQRLVDAGLARPKGMTEVAYAEMQKGLVGWLAYMGAENLKTLAEVVIDNAIGGRCASEALIRTWAKGLQVKPPEEHRIITSWLASEEGPKAISRGDLVEMYRFLRAKPLPLGPMDRRDIALEAEANQRERHQIEGRISRGADRAEDHAWLAEYERDERRANDIVAAGASSRAARAKANGVAA